MSYYYDYSSYDTYAGGGVGEFAKKIAKSKASTGALVVLSMCLIVVFVFLLKNEDEGMSGMKIALLVVGSVFSFLVWLLSTGKFATMD
jgi:hypothetical protein